jgi:hypothetical protein
VLTKEELVRLETEELERIRTEYLADQAARAEQERLRERDEKLAKIQYFAF